MSGCFKDNGDFIDELKTNNHTMTPPTTTPRTDAFCNRPHVAWDVQWIEHARQLEQELAAAREELTKCGHIFGKMGLLAGELTGGSNNESAETDLEQIRIVAQGALLTAKKYENAHKLFDWNIVELLQRCQNGEATCIFTAQIIEAEATKLREENAALRADLKECHRLLLVWGPESAIGGQFDAARAANKNDAQQQNSTEGRQ